MLALYDLLTMSDDVDAIKRHASYKNMTPRKYCISKIEEWRENLEAVSEDYRELSEESFQKKLDEEIQQRD